jgi:perosamine synthetase
MLVTDREDVWRHARRLRWMGIDKDTWDRTEDAEEKARTGVRRYAGYHWYYEVAELGFKCHMNDITAAIGLVQLGKLDAANERRRAIRSRYDLAFAGLPGLQTPSPQPFPSASHNYVVRLDRRDDLNVHLRDRRIASGVHYLPVHLQPYYRDRYAADVPVTEEVWKRLLTLPMYPDLSEEDLQRVVDAVREFLAA